MLWKYKKKTTTLMFGWNPSENSIRGRKKDRTRTSTKIWFMLLEVFVYIKNVYILRCIVLILIWLKCYVISSSRFYSSFSLSHSMYIYIYICVPEWWCYTVQSQNVYSWFHFYSLCVTVYSTLTIVSMKINIDWSSRKKRTSKFVRLLA